MTELAESAAVELNKLITREAERDNLTWLQAYERLRSEAPELIASYQRAERPGFKTLAPEFEQERMNNLSDTLLIKYPEHPELAHDKKFVYDLLQLIDLGYGNFPSGLPIFDLKKKYPALLSWLQSNNDT